MLVCCTDAYMRQSASMSLWRSRIIYSSEIVIRWTCYLISPFVWRRSYNQAVVAAGMDEGGVGISPGAGLCRGRLQQWPLDWEICKSSANRPHQAAQTVTGRWLHRLWYLLCLPLLGILKNEEGRDYLWNMTVQIIWSPINAISEV